MNLTKFEGEQFDKDKRGLDMTFMIEKVVVY